MDSIRAIGPHMTCPAFSAERGSCLAVRGQRRRYLASALQDVSTKPKLLALIGICSHTRKLLSKRVVTAFSCSKHASWNSLARAPYSCHRRLKTIMRCMAYVECARNEFVKGSSAKYLGKYPISTFVPLHPLICITLQHPLAPRRCETPKQMDVSSNRKNPNLRI